MGYGVLYAPIYNMFLWIFNVENYDGNTWK